MSHFPNAKWVLGGAIIDVVRNSAISGGVGVCALRPGASRLVQLQPQHRLLTTWHAL